MEISEQLVNDPTVRMTSQILSSEALVHLVFIRILLANSPSAEASAKLRWGTGVASQSGM